MLIDGSSFEQWRDELEVLATLGELVGDTFFSFGDIFRGGPE